MKRLGLGAEELTRPLPAPDLRVDHRVRRHRAVGRPAGLRVGHRRRGRDHQVAGRRPRRRLRQRPAQPRRHVHRHGADDRHPRRALPAPRDRRRPVIDVSMAETMLFVNDHLNDELWDGPEDPQAIRNFGPGDYIVFDARPTATTSSSAAIRPSGARSRCSSRVRRRPTSPTTPASPTSPAARTTSTSCASCCSTRPRKIPDAPTFEEPAPRHKLAVGRLRSGRELADSDWARRPRCDRRGLRPRRRRRSASPTRRGTSAAAEVGLQGGPKYRGEDNRAVLAEVLGYDDATIDALEADGVLSSRVPSAAGERLSGRRGDACRSPSRR